MLKDNKVDNKTIFFIRHFNDFDFLLPIIILFEKPKLVFVNKVKLYDFQFQVIRNNNISIYKNSNLNIYLAYTFKILQRVLSLININSILFKKIESYFILKNIKKFILINKKNLVNNFVFDHTVDSNSQKLIKFIKQKFEKPKILSVPHGVDCFSNRMNDIFDIENNKIDYSIYDKVICNDKNQYDRILNTNKEIIPNLRYTHEWVDNIKNNFLLNRNNYKDKLTFLIIHSKKIGNIHFAEVLRCLKILNKFKNFQVIIKPHPRISKNNNEIKSMLKVDKNIRISFSHMIDISNNVDFIITFQSSAFFDGLLLNKPIIFPKYVSSNIIDQNILQYLTVIDSPDLFLNTVENINKNHSIFTNKKLQVVNYHNLILKWKKIFT